MGLLFAGVATGLVSTLAFATVHAILIVPIWTRILTGVPFAILTGIAMAWAMDATAAARGPLTLAGAGRFGSALWLTLAPATALENGLRLAARHIPESAGVAAAVSLAVVSGGCVGWSVARRRSCVLGPFSLCRSSNQVPVLPRTGEFERAARDTTVRTALAWAGASLALMLAMGGPIPVANSTRAAWLYAAFLPMCAGAAIASVVARRAWADIIHIHGAYRARAAGAVRL